jgi:formamidopyrimidine-DNA glycosylase
MPELPDVEGYRQTLLPVIGARVVRVEVLDAGVLRGVSAEVFCREVTGEILASPWRHGKWLMVPLRSPGRRHRRTDPSLVFHFGMTGGMVVTRGEPPPPGGAGVGMAGKTYDRIVFTVSGGVVHYRDMRKLQGVRLLGGDRDVAALLGDLGPDAGSISSGDFAAQLQGRRGQLKPALMGQRVVAGLGNLLVDEILWRARLHPSRQIAGLTGVERGRLYRAMRTVVGQSIKRGRVPDLPSWLTGHRAVEGAPCPRCGTPLQRGRIGGRTTIWCPRDQPRDGSAAEATKVSGP